MHARLHHAPARIMVDRLKTTGAPQHVLHEAQSVVNTCRTFREWQRRTDTSAVSLTLTSPFNEDLQPGLLSVDDGILAHLICLCIGWAQGFLVKLCEPGDILPALEHRRFRVYDSPSFITSDHEGALFADEEGIWADRRNIELRVKTKRTACACHQEAR